MKIKSQIGNKSINDKKRETDMTLQQKGVWLHQKVEAQNGKEAHSFVKL
jgi:hypothetical protein